MQNPNHEPNSTDDLTGLPVEHQVSSTVFGTSSPTEKAASEKTGMTDNLPSANANAAGHAEMHHATGSAFGKPADGETGKQKTGDVTAILEEIELKRQLNRTDPSVANSSAERNVTDPAVTMREKPTSSSGKKTNAGNAALSPANTKSGTKQAAGTSRKSGTKSKAQNGKRKKKKRKRTFVDFLKGIIPWRGDSVLESIRKIIFIGAIAVVCGCAFLISNYYLMLYRSKQEYEEIRNQLAETLNNRGYSNENSYITDPESGEVIEYLEQNEIADRLLSQNPDLVGYITIDGTEVSYPVVQKKSSDPNNNTNDYYLYRSFKQESSKAGCIFMDFRCHFDEVYNHRRTIENSDNLIIYGHNMNNRSMFGSLKDYIRNYSYLSEHPIVHLQSLYKSYNYKIFAVFLVDSEDKDSEFAFDCWNTLDFNDETAFYHFVNEAKKRTIISTEVDVTYGDPILTLYTCNSTVPNAKLILMCRLMRTGEDPYEGVENSGLNPNALYPKSYYNNHDYNYDPDLFVPYGPSED